MGDVLWPNGTKTKPYVTSAFGPRKAPIPGASTYHRGTDMVGFSIIRAVADGIVQVAGSRAGWSAGGTQVWVQHDGFFSRSLHMSSIWVGIRAGMRVVAGEPLGIMGRTGTATDVHLHFEITPGSVHGANTGQVDPVAFITDLLASTAGGGSAPIPSAPVALAIRTEDKMRLLYITDDVDGNKRPGWALFNDDTGKWIPLVNDDSRKAQDQANSWARPLNQKAAYCTRQDALNLAAGIRATS